MKTSVRQQKEEKEAESRRGRRSGAMECGRGKQKVAEQKEAHLVFGLQV